MTDFQKALASLKTADISFIAPNSSTAPPPPRFSPRIRRSIRRTRNHDAGTGNPNPSEPSSNGTTSSSIARNGARSNSTGAMPAPANKSAPKATIAKQAHTRQRIERDWPSVGTVVSGNYFGTVYRAQVVKANKNLKSGRQLRLMDGPCKGRRFDSFTKALLVATTRQRKEANLGRRQASNGWDFWQPESPAAVSK